MTKQDIKKVLIIISVEYPNEMTEDKFEAKVNLWYDAFRGYEPCVIETAVKMALRTSHFCPKLADIETCIQDICQSVAVQPERIWQQMLIAAYRIADCRECSNYTWVESNGRTQGDNMREQAREIYESLPAEVRMFCGSMNGALQLAAMDNDNLVYEKGRFLKRYVELRKYERIRQITPKECYAALKRFYLLAVGCAKRLGDAEQEKALLEKE